MADHNTDMIFRQIRTPPVSLWILLSQGQYRRPGFLLADKASENPLLTLDVSNL